MTDPDPTADLLTQVLYDTETTGGWWGRPECEEFGHLVAAGLRARGYVIRLDVTEVPAPPIGVGNRVLAALFGVWRRPRRTR